MKLFFLSFVLCYFIVSGGGGSGSDSNNKHKYKSIESFCKYDPSHCKCIDKELLPVFNFCFHDKMHPNCLKEKKKYVFSNQSISSVNENDLYNLLNIYKNNYGTTISGFFFSSIIIYYICVAITTWYYNKIISKLIHLIDINGLRYHENNSFISNENKQMMTYILNLNERIEVVINKEIKTPVPSTQKCLFTEIINEIVDIIREINSRRLNINTNKLELRIKEIELNRIIYRIISSNQSDINETLLSGYIDKAYECHFESEIIQHAKELLDVKQRVNQTLCCIKNNNNRFSDITTIIETTPKCIEDRLNTTFRKVRMEVNRYNKKNTLIKLGSQKLINDDDYNDDDDDSVKNLLFRHGDDIVHPHDSTANVYIKMNIIKMVNDNEQRELDRLNIERQTDKQIEQKIISDTRKHELKTKLLLEKIKQTDNDIARFNIKLEENNTLKMNQLDQIESDLYLKDLNRFYVFVILQVIFSVMIYGIGSFDTFLFDTCRNSQMCFLNLVCIKNPLPTLCENMIFGSVILLIVCILLIIAYLNIGYYGILFGVLFLFRWNGIFFDFICYHGVILFLQFIVVYYFAGKSRWKFNEFIDMKFIFNCIFVTVSLVLCFLATIYLSSNKNKSCSVFNLKYFQECQPIKRFF
jgi:hypothetical protein